MTGARTDRFKTIAVWALFALCVSFPAISSAQDDPEQAAREAAKLHYQNGKQLYEKSRYAEALKEFQAAYDAKPHPVVLKSIAECKVLLGDVPGAVENLKQFLADSRTAENVKPPVQQRLAELNRLIGTLAVTSTPAGAEIALDGKPTGQVTPAELNVGLAAHEVVLTVDGYEPLTKKTEIKIGGDRVDVAFDFEKEGTPTKMDERLIDPFAGAEEEAEEEAEPPAAKKEKGGPHPAFWACAAIAGAGLISGTVFGTLALNDEDDYNRRPTQEKKDAGERNALIADISFGVAVAAAIAGTVVILTVDRDKGKAEKKPGGDRSAARIVVVPVAGADAIGLNTTVHF